MISFAKTHLTYLIFDNKNGEIDRCTLNTSAQLKPKFVSILRNIKLPWMQTMRKYILVDANFTLT